MVYENARTVFDGMSAPSSLTKFELVRLHDFLGRSTLVLDLDLGS